MMRGSALARAATATVEKETLELDYVPYGMVRLVRMVMRGFFDIDSCILMDYVLHFPGISEEHLTTRLHFDIKHVRRLTNELCRDKLLRYKTKPENGKLRYYYVNYVQFVKVVRFRLDQVRIGIDGMALESSGSSRFFCEPCGRTYTDLDVDRLLRIDTGTLHCLECNKELRANEDQGTKSRQLTIDFNNHFAPLFALLREFENVQFTERLMDPAPLVELDQGTSSSLLSLRDLKEESTEEKKADEVLVILEKQANGTSEARKQQPVWFVWSTIDGGPFLPVDNESASCIDKGATEQNDLKKLYDLVVRLEVENLKGYKHGVLSSLLPSFSLRAREVPKCMLSDGQMKPVTSISAEDYNKMNSVEKDALVKMCKMYVDSVF